MNQRLTSWDSFCFKVAIIRALRKYGVVDVRTLNANREFPEEYRTRLSNTLERLHGDSIVYQYGTPKSYRYSNHKGAIERVAQLHGYTVTSAPKPGKEFEAMTSAAPHKSPKQKSTDTQGSLFQDGGGTAPKSKFRQVHGVDVDSLSATQRAALLKELSGYIK